MNDNFGFKLLLDYVGKKVYAQDVSPVPVWLKKMRWSFDILCKHVKYGWPAVTEKKNLQNKSEIMKKKVN
jgi:hypothetical protein